MPLHKIKKLTVVTEATILDNIIQIAIDSGVDSYTVDRVGGKGERGVKFSSDMSGMLTNIRISFITNSELAEKIANEVRDTYFSNYAGIVYLQDVEVIQTKKFHIVE